MQERPAQLGDLFLPLHLPHPTFLYDLSLRNCQLIPENLVHDDRC